MRRSRARRLDASAHAASGGNARPTLLPGSPPAGVDSTDPPPRDLPSHDPGPHRFGRHAHARGRASGRGSDLRPAARAARPEARDGGEPDARSRSFSRKEKNLGALNERLLKDKNLTARYLARLGEQERALLEDLTTGQTHLDRRSTEHDRTAAALRRRLRAYQRARHPQTAELLLSSKNFTDLFARAALLGRAIQRDRTDVIWLRQQRDELAVADVRARVAPSRDSDPARGEDPREGEDRAEVGAGRATDRPDPRRAHGLREAAEGARARRGADPRPSRTPRGGASQGAEGWQGARAFRSRDRRPPGRPAVAHGREGDRAVRGGAPSALRNEGAEQRHRYRGPGGDGGQVDRPGRGRVRGLAIGLRPVCDREPRRWILYALCALLARPRRHRREDLQKARRSPRSAIPIR